MALAGPKVRVRHEAAQLLGFDCHSGYILAVKMAESTDQATRFVEDLIAKLGPMAESQRDQLVAFQGGEAADGMACWNKPFYSRKQKEEQFCIDEEAISEYFPLGSVLKGLMDIYAELLNLRFVAVRTTHPTRALRLT